MKDAAAGIRLCLAPLASTHLPSPPLCFSLPALFCLCGSGIGSGGLYALSAARALVDVPDLTPRQIAVKVRRSHACGEMCTSLQIRPRALLALSLSTR